MNTTKPTLLLFKIGLISLTTLIIVTLTSFKNDRSAIKSTIYASVPPADELELLGVFTLDYAKFDALGGSWDRRLILQFITSVTATGTKYDVAAFLATSQEDHATDETPIPLTSQTLTGLDLTKGKTYYIGNNYIRMRTIRRYINSVIDDNSGKSIKYLKFSAVSWKGKSPDHVFFLVQAVGESDVPLKTTDIDFGSESIRIADGGVFSNPSPPADPSTN